MTYDYTCTHCQHCWEEDQQITDDPKKQCPKCQQDTAKRLISGGNFILKNGGVGWGSNGYSK